MIRRLRSLVALFAALVALPMLATPAAAQRQVEDPPETWVHKHVGVGFASHLGDFARANIIEYNDDGSDASVGYDLIRSGRKLATVTVYVYPPFPIGGCENQYADVKKSVFNGRYENVRLISEDRVASPSGRHPGTAYRAVFGFDFDFAGKKQHVRSEAYLFCPAGEKWLVAYRATWPDDVDAATDVQTLFHAFDWPAMLDN